MQLRTLHDLIVQMRNLKDLEALRYNNGYRTFSYTYTELYRSIAGVAGFLAEIGLQPGDTLIVQGENRPAWVILFWASIARGVRVVPIDTGVSGQFVHKIIQRSGAKVVFGRDTMNSDSFPLAVYPLQSLEEVQYRSECDFAPVHPETEVEMVFTSGTTGSPKGLLHTHENICSDLRPFLPEFERYRKFLLPFRPLRILNLLPYSHMFGQALGLFIPVLLEGCTVISREMNPNSLIWLIKKEKVSVLNTVPGHLDKLKNYLDARYGCSERPVKRHGKTGIIERILRFRDIHSLMGWKFWVVVTGGSKLPEQLESWWRRTGFLMVQGYGLTEASPIVALNHPFNSRSGSLGKVLEGQEVKLASDGEILVRGPNIAGQYWEQDPFGSGPKQSNGTDENGWFHTGDIGYMDQEGRLYYQGRKKDTIVTAEGLNVFPEDVEKALWQQGGLRDCAVVGVNRNGQEEVHAVLLDPQIRDPERIVRGANADLESYQYIRSWSVWPYEDFPRTTATGKVKRTRVREILQGEQVEEQNKQSYPPDSGSGFLTLLARIAGMQEDKIDYDFRLNQDLGLSSLKRIELLSELEEHYQIRGDEQAFAGIETVGELRDWIFRGREETFSRAEDPAGQIADSGRASREGRHSEQGRAMAERSLGPPRWNRYRPVATLRAILQECLLLPFFRFYLGIRVKGLENIKSLTPPFLVAANHSSHLDVIAILCALPRKLRRKLAPTMAQEHFYPLIYPGKYSGFKKAGFWMQYLMSCFLFNAYPLPQKTPGTRNALRYSGELAENGYCTLIFPEGIRSPDGNIRSFQPGVGLLSRELQVPVIPVRVKGLFSLFSVHHKLPRPGRVEVEFLPPVQEVPFQGPEEISAKLEQAVRSADKK